MKKIILFGATGFLGSYLSEYLKSSYKLYRFGRRKNADYNINLLNKSQLSKCLNEIKPNIMINLVAETNVDRCENYKRDCYSKNFQIVKNLTNYCKNNNVKIIQISTDQVYDGKYGANLEKNIKLRNYYAKTKLLAEKEIIKSKGCVIRTNFFGYNKTENKGIINWIIHSSKFKKKITLYNNIFFSPLYVETLAKLIKHVSKNFHKGVYNLGSNDYISKGNFIKKINKSLNLKLKYFESSYIYNKKNSIAKRPLNMIMNSNKFTKKFKVKLPNIMNEINKLKKNVKI